MSTSYSPARSARGIATDFAAIALGLLAIVMSIIWWLGLPLGVAGVAIGLLLRRRALHGRPATITMLLGAVAIATSLVVAIAATPVEASGPHPAESRPAMPSGP